MKDLATTIKTTVMVRGNSDYHGMNSGKHQESCGNEDGGDNLSDDGHGNQQGDDKAGYQQEADDEDDGANDEDDRQ